MKCYAVIDTNVLVSALLKRTKPMTHFLSRET